MLQGVPRMGVPQQPAPLHAIAPPRTTRRGCVTHICPPLENPASSRICVQEHSQPWLPRAAEFVPRTAAGTCPAAQREHNAGGPGHGLAKMHAAPRDGRLA